MEGIVGGIVEGIVVVDIVGLGRIVAGSIVGVVRIGEVHNTVESVAVGIEVGDTGVVVAGVVDMWCHGAAN